MTDACAANPGDVSTLSLVRDARSSTWQFVIPGDGGELLALAPPQDCPAGAVPVVPGTLAGHARPAGWSAVAAPDLATVLAEVGGADVRAALDVLAGLVAPGGWLLVGAGNRWYPGGPREGRLGLAALRRRLQRAGLRIDAVYLAMPDHQRPAVLAAAHPARALDEVLYRLPTTYVDGSTRWPRARRRARSVLVSAAGAAPHSARLRFAPGFVVVARRPA